MQEMLQDLKKKNLLEKSLYIQPNTIEYIATYNCIILPTHMPCTMDCPANQTSKADLNWCGSRSLPSTCRKTAHKDIHTRPQQHCSGWKAAFQNILEPPCQRLFCRDYDFSEVTLPLSSILLKLLTAEWVQSGQENGRKKLLLNNLSSADHAAKLLLCSGSIPAHMQRYRSVQIVDRWLRMISRMSD